MPGLRLIGTAQKKTSVLSFPLANHKTEDVDRALNQAGIAVRSGLDRRNCMHRRPRWK